MRQRRKSLKETLFLKVIIGPLIGFIVMSMIFASILYNTEYTQTKEVLKQRNQAIAYFLSSYFSRFYKSLELLSENDVIVRAPWISEKKRKKALEILLLLQRSTPGAHYIYAGYKNGYLLINNYVPPKNFDPRVRPWYVAALRSAPKSSNGILYREIKTKELLFSVSRAMYDDNGTFTGVIAVDASVESIKKLMEQKFGSFRSAKSYILKESGGVISFDSISETYRGGLAEKIKQTIVNSKTTYGTLTYAENGKKQLIYFSHLKELKWCVVTSVDEAEIYQPILIKIGWIVLLFILYALLAGWILSAVIAKEVIKPLITLREDITDVVDGKKIHHNRLSGYYYTEIGSIAENIEKITRDELFRQNNKLSKLNEQLEYISSHDALTGLLNRRKIAEKLHEEFERAKRYETPFSLIFFDVDHFKQINDRYGHDIGDEVLKAIADIISRHTRETDYFGRWGGEEFLIVVPQTDGKGAIELAEHLRKMIEKATFSDRVKATISIGVLTFNGHSSIKEMLSEVDQKLYKAKKKGRNRVVA